MWETAQKAEKIWFQEYFCIQIMINGDFFLCCLKYYCNRFLCTDKRVFFLFWLLILLLIETINVPIVCWRQFFWIREFLLFWGEDGRISSWTFGELISVNEVFWLGNRSRCRTGRLDLKFQVIASRTLLNV